MNVDFTAILAVLSIATGVIWGAYVLLLKLKNKDQVEASTVETEAKSDKTKDDKEKGKAKSDKTKDDKEKGKAKKEPLLVEFSRFLFPVFMVVLIVRGFLVEPFQIPSGSMLPTLEAGDYILVNKFSYGLRSPLGYFKLVDLGEPERGDVIVFRYPENPEIDYIKRVVGIPGDRLKYVNKILYINDEPAMIKPLHPYAKDPRFMELQEKLGEITHNVLHNPYESSMPVGEIVVPENSYFVLGDNRDNSRDSRYWNFVPDENLKGRAFMIWLHKKQGEWPSQWSRIGTIIE